jgi:hypothetical protein
MDIIRCPAFYLELNSVGLSLPHRKDITSPLRAHRLMLFMGLGRWYINITITILDIIHRTVFYLKHDVSEFYHSLQVEPTQLSTIDRASPRLRTPANKKNTCFQKVTNLMFVSDSNTVLE